MRTFASMTDEDMAISERAADRGRYPEVFEMQLGDRQDARIMNGKEKNREKENG